jgi:plasmid maintenance system killer protein
VLLLESPVAIKSFGDDRTMRIDGGEAVSGLPTPLLPKIRRMLWALEAASSLATLRTVPSFSAGTLAEGNCSVSIDPHWKLTFRWHDEDAWYVRVEEA